MSSGSLGLRQQMLERLARTNGVAHERGAISTRRRAEALRRARRVTIFIVDADEIVRLGVRTMLSGERDFAVVGESDSIARMVSLAPSLRPMVAIIAGPSVDGGVLDACRQLKAVTPDVRVIILARDVNAVSVIEAVRAGA